MNIDYSSLSQPLTEQDIARFKAAHAVKSGKHSYIAFAIVYGLIVLGFGSYMLYTYQQWGRLDALSIFIIALPLPLFIGIILYQVFKTRLRSKLYRFATANNARLMIDESEPGYSGLIFDEGYSRMVTEAYIFEDGSEIGNYRYVTGSGKHQRTHTWSYARVKLSRHLPHMVLDAKKNNLFGKFSNIPDSFDRQQTLSLEGDFNDHFTLFAPKQYERDALYVFTPDVMAAAIDSGKDFDIEVIDNNLMMYSEMPIRLDHAEEIGKLLGVMEHIGNELRDQSSYYADERTGSRAADTVAAPGKRLRPGFRVTTGLIILAILIYQIVSAILRAMQ